MWTTIVFTGPSSLNTVIPYPYYKAALQPTSWTSTATLPTSENARVKPPIPRVEGHAQASPDCALFRRFATTQPIWMGHKHTTAFKKIRFKIFVGRLRQHGGLWYQAFTPKVRVANGSKRFFRCYYESVLFDIFSTHHHPIVAFRKLNLKFPGLSL